MSFGIKYTQNQVADYILVSVCRAGLSKFWKRKNQSEIIVANICRQLLEKASEVVNMRATISDAHDC